MSGELREVVRHEVKTENTDYLFWAIGKNPRYGETKESDDSEGIVRVYSFLPCQINSSGQPLRFRNGSTLLSPFT